MGARERARPGRMMSETFPQPPKGSFSLAAMMRRIAAVTKLGREMPMRVMERLDQSRGPPRGTAARVPTPMPTRRASMRAKKPRVMETGREDLTMSLTDHSLYCMDGPKSPLVMMLMGYQ